MVCDGVCVCVCVSECGLPYHRTLRVDTPCRLLPKVEREGWSWAPFRLDKKAATIDTNALTSSTLRERCAIFDSCTSYKPKQIYRERKRKRKRKREKEKERKRKREREKEKERKRKKCFKKEGMH